MSVLFPSEERYPWEKVVVWASLHCSLHLGVCTCVCVVGWFLFHLCDLEWLPISRANCSLGSCDTVMISDTTVGHWPHSSQEWAQLKVQPIVSGTAKSALIATASSAQAVNGPVSLNIRTSQHLVFTFVRSLSPNKVKISGTDWGGISV